MTGTQGQRSQRDLLHPHFTVLHRAEFRLSSGLSVLTTAQSQMDPSPLSQTLVFSGNFTVPLPAHMDVSLAQHRGSRKGQDQ